MKSSSLIVVNGVIIKPENFSDLPTNVKDSVVRCAAALMHWSPIQAPVRKTTSINTGCDVPFGYRFDPSPHRL